METNGENYFCPYCRTHYQAEAYKYLITRFFIEGAFHPFRSIWLLFLPPLVLAVLQGKGMLRQEQWESLLVSVSYALGIFFTVLFFFALAKGLKAFFRHLSVQKKIRTHDPGFSREIFTMRLNDLLSMNPEILIPEKDQKKKPCGVICRNVLNLEFQSYERRDDLEIVKCRGTADALYLKGHPGQVHLQDRYQKFTVRVARIYGTLTPVHYLPDQFTCRNCGSHQVTEHAGMQVCSFCHTKHPMESIDWVLCRQIRGD